MALPTPVCSVCFAMCNVPEKKHTVNVTLPTPVCSVCFVVCKTLQHTANKQHPVVSFGLIAIGSQKAKCLQIKARSQKNRNNWYMLYFESFTCIPLCKLVVTYISLYIPEKLSRTFIPSPEFFFTYVPFWTEFTLTVSNGGRERPFCPTESTSHCSASPPHHGPRLVILWSKFWWEIVGIWAWPIKAHVVQTFNLTLLVEVEETMWLSYISNP